MEADWSIACGPDDPGIVVPWEASGEAAQCRFVDLRVAPHRIEEIAEAQANAPLRSALLRLNGAGSPLWTAKCDAWTTSPQNGDAPFDPYEMDAEPGTTAFGAGCYLDLLPRQAPLFASFAKKKQWMRAVIDSLRAMPASAARVELVMRPAEVDRSAGFGFTCFVEGCGATAHAAGQSWAEALGLAVAVLLDTPCPSGFLDDTMGKTGE